MGGRWLSLAIVAGVFTWLPGWVPAAMAVCVPATRDIGFVDGSARVTNVVCQIDDAASPQIQVEFDRLSEAVAGSIIEGFSYPDVERALGDSRIYANEVFAEAKDLFDNYGTKDATQTCYGFAIGVGPGPGIAYAGKGATSDPCGERRILEYLTFPDQRYLTGMTLALPDDQHQMRASNSWPAGWNFFYYDCPAKSMIECTVLWRSARASDMADYEDRVRQYETRLGLPLDGTSAGSSAGERNPVSRRLIGLIKRLTANGWPDNFMLVTGSVPSCGSGMEFSLRFRQLILEVALVRNVSDDTLPIDGLLGSIDSTHALRPNPQKSPGDPSTPIPMQRLDLASGETLLIPLRILFVPAGGAEAVFQNGSSSITIDKAFADQQFKAITASPPGTIFKENSKAATPLLSKTRASFGPPTVPEMPWYLYGPAIEMTGLTLAGQRLTIDGAARNFFNVVAGTGYGSCP